MTSIKDRVAKSVFWIVWSRGGVQLLSGISQIFVARFWLEPSDYGLMAIVGVWTTTIGLLAEMGIGTAIIQFQDLTEEELNSCYWLMMAIGLSGYFGLFVSAPFIADWFNSPLLSDLLRFGGLTLPLIALIVVPDSLMRKRVQLDKIAKIQLGGALAAIFTVVTMAASGAGVWALVSGPLVAQVVVYLSMLWVEPWRPGIRIGSTRLSEILHFSFSTLGSRFLFSLYNQVDLVLLGKLTGEATLGFYSYAKELAMLPVVRGSVVVNQLAFPVMAELQNDINAMRLSFMKGLRLVSGTFFPVCVGMALVAHDAVLVLLTEKWLPLVPMLQVLCVYGSIKSLDVLLPPVLYARFRHQFILFYTMALLVIMSIAFGLGAMWYGAMGVVLSWIIVYPMIMMGLVKEVLKELEMNLRAFFQQIGVAVIATLIMVVIVLMAQTFIFPSANVNPIVRLILASGLGAFVYGSVLFILGGQLVEELKEVFRWVCLPKRTANAGGPS